MKLLLVPQSRSSALGDWFILAVFLSSVSAAAEPVRAATELHVVLVGDSTVTDESGWGTGFAACLDDKAKCTNLARGGRSSSSFREEGHWQRALELKPDWVLIQFGHNDEPGHPGKENPPEEGYKENLVRYVEEAREAGIQPVLITPLCRRQWRKSGKCGEQVVSSLAPYAEVAKRIAAAHDVPLIDLHWRSREVYHSLGKTGCEMISPRKDNGQWDGTHLNEAGAVMFGSMVAMDCRSYVPDLGNHFLTSKLMQLQQSHPAPTQSGERTVSSAAQSSQSTNEGALRIVVAQDGSGDFCSIQEAVAAVTDNSTERTRIVVQPGVYTGQIFIPPSKANISLVGADRKQSIISYALTVHDPIPAGVPNGFHGTGVVVLAPGFEASNLTFRQVAGDHGQAIALRLDGDRARILDCDILGWQDTLRLEKGRHYLRNCYIEGRVDYVYGGATAWLDNCHLHTKRDGYVTAASTPNENKWGYVFSNCRFTGTGNNLVYFGRPWRPHASITLLNCELDESIRPAGWDNWRNPANEKTVRYSEFASRGPGANPQGRVPWSRQLTQAEANTISITEVLGGADGWSPEQN